MFVLKNTIKTKNLYIGLTNELCYLYNTVEVCYSSDTVWKGGRDMVSFETFILENDGPIYWQIIRFILRGIVAGTIVDGDEMPSRRVLSTRLGVNPNTIQKAYRMLEEDGLILSHAGAKSCVSLQPGQLEEIRRQLLAEDAGRLISAMRQMGVSRGEALELMERLWDETEGGDAL